MAKQRVIIHVSDAKISNDPEDVLITYSLGSCIGVCLYDPVLHLGGMLHYQLPDSRLDPAKAQDYPFMFADTGMRLLVDKLLSLGADRRRLYVKIAGGATMSGSPQGFDIGKRNHLAIRKITWQDRLFINSEEVGGSTARTMYLDMAGGDVTIKSDGAVMAL